MEQPVFQKTTHSVLISDDLGSIKLYDLLNQKLLRSWSQTNRKSAIEHIRWVEHPSALSFVTANGILGLFNCSNFAPYSIIHIPELDSQPVISSAPLSWRRRSKWITDSTVLDHSHTSSQETVSTIISTTCRGTCVISKLSSQNNNVAVHSKFSLSGAGSWNGTGCNVDAVCISPNKKHLAYGGEENNLKVVDIESQKIIFKAKNIPHDWLNLSKKLYFTNIKYLSSDLFPIDQASDESLSFSSNQIESPIILATSKFGEFRIFDIRQGPRPLANVKLPQSDLPIMSLDFDQTGKVCIAGNNQGRIFAWDIISRKYVYAVKPGNASVSKILYHPKYSFGSKSGEKAAVDDFTHPAFCISISLDRYVKMHRVSSRHGRKVVKSIYTKSTPTDLLWFSYSQHEENLDEEDDDEHLWDSLRSARLAPDDNKQPIEPESLRKCKE